MKISVVSIPVSDQAAALKFYTDTLGFVKKHDISLGGENRWLTVVSKDDPDGPELLLEPSPNHFAPAKTFQQEVYNAGMPWTQFNVDNVAEEFTRLTKLGVKFSVEPMDAGMAKIGIFDDTCGNRIQLVEMK